MNALSIYVPFEKSDDEQRMVWGYASTEALDLQGDRVSLEAVRDALPDYMKFGTVCEMHQKIPVGKTVEARVDDKGLYIGVKVVDDNAWKKVKAGLYKAFSIKGNGVKVGEWVKKLFIREISFCDVGANPEAVFDLWKSGDPSLRDEKENETMNLKKFGLSENASEADVEKALTDRDAKLEKAVADSKKAADDAKAAGEKVTAIQKELEDAKSKGATASELEQKVTKLEKALADNMAAQKKARRDVVVSGAVAEGRIKEEKREQWEKDFDSNEELVTRMLGDIPKGQAVPMGKRSGSGAGADVEKSAMQRFEELAEKIQKEQTAKLPVGQLFPLEKAYELAMKADSDLWDERNVESLEKAATSGSPLGPTRK